MRNKQYEGKSGTNMSTVSSSQGAGGACPSTPGGILSGSTYSIRGSNTASASAAKMKEFNQYRDRMQANISKMKSLRETGEFEISQISSTINSIHNASISGTSEVNLDTAPSNDHFPQNNMQLRSSDQVLMAEPNIDNSRGDFSRHQHDNNRSLNQSRASSSYQSVHHYQQN